MCWESQDDRQREEDDPSTGMKGSRDIKCCINGRFVAIEVKFGADRQSEVQKEYEQKVKRAGGIYLIVRNFDEFVSGGIKI